MGKPKITLYLDIVSPFAYIAFEVLQKSPTFKNCDITYVPIFLGGLVAACGGIAPIKIKNKDKWIFNERLRWATYFSIPMTPGVPDGFPINTLPIERVLAALSISHPHKLNDAISLFWQNFWVEYNDPTKPENMLAIMSKILGSEEEAKKVVEASKSAEGKERLKSNTDRSFEEGAFGVPWFVATNSKGEKEGFWGVDHMAQLCAFLELEKPEGKAWKAML